MRKNQKTALGLLGLSAVVGMTAVAAQLPTPASAVSSVSDTITVVVLEGTATVAITNLAEGSIVVQPDMSVHFDYTNLQTMKVSLSYKEPGAQGITTTTLDELNFTMDEHNGSVDVNFDLNDYIGYGEYTISVEGSGFGATATPSAVAFLYSPVSIEGIGDQTDANGVILGSNIPTDEQDGNPILDVIAADEIDHVLIDVFDKDGNKVISNFDSHNVPGNIALPFLEKGLPSGDYIIQITAMSGNTSVATPIRLFYTYEAPDIPEVPDTGNFLQKLNISEADYFATGLIIFGCALVVAVLLFAKKKQHRH